MENAIRAARERWGPIQAVLCESAASGIAVAQRLRINVGGVIEITPQGGKVARMAACSPEFQAGDWYFPRHASWTNPLVQQLMTFPNASHDDMCDAISQAAIWLQANASYGRGGTISVSESRFGIKALREYLAGGVPGALPAELSAKIIAGGPGYSLSSAEEWEILKTSLPEGALE